MSTYSVSDAIAVEGSRAAGSRAEAIGETLVDEKKPDLIAGTLFAIGKRALRLPHFIPREHCPSKRWLHWVVLYR